MDAAVRVIILGVRSASASQGANVNTTGQHLYRYGSYLVRTMKISVSKVSVEISITEIICLITALLKLYLMLP